MSTVKLLALDPTYGVPTEVGSADNAQVAQLTLSGIGGVAIDASNNRIINVATPTSANDGVNKAYVDNLAQGIDKMANVAALANSNVALTGLQIVDGYQLTAGDRVLLISQTNAIQNGIWIAASGAWTRPAGQTDYAPGTGASGVYVFVQAGNNFANNGYICNTVKGSDVVDTNATTWIQFTAAGEIVAGNGLQKGAVNGNSLSVVLAPASGLQFSSGAVDTLLSTTGSITKGAAGLSLLLNNNATLASDASGLRVLGLPSQFSINGVNVGANVTTTNVNALVDGNNSLVDSLHSHQSVLESLATVATHKNGSTSLSAGDPVQWSSSADTLQRCDAVALAKSQCIGIAAASIAANANGKVVKRGVAAGVLTQATPGTAYYLAAGGGLTSTITTAFSGVVIRLGYAKNSTDLDVNPVLISQRSAS